MKVTPQESFIRQGKLHPEFPQRRVRKEGRRKRTNKNLRINKSQVRLHIEQIHIIRNIAQHYLPYACTLL